MDMDRDRSQSTVEMETRRAGRQEKSTEFFTSSPSHRRAHIKFRIDICAYTIHSLCTSQYKTFFMCCNTVCIVFVYAHIRSIVYVLHHSTKRSLCAATNTVCIVFVYAHIRSIVYLLQILFIFMVVSKLLLLIWIQPFQRYTD